MLQAIIKILMASAALGTLALCLLDEGLVILIPVLCLVLVTLFLL